jgi:hypothetical protein
MAAIKSLDCAAEPQIGNDFTNLQPAFLVVIQKSALPFGSRLNLSAT